MPSFSRCGHSKIVFVRKMLCRRNNVVATNRNCTQEWTTKASTYPTMLYKSKSVDKHPESTYIAHSSPRFIQDINHQIRIDHAPYCNERAPCKPPRRKRKPLQTHRNKQGVRPVAREANVVRVHVEVDAELLHLQLVDAASRALRALETGELEDVLDDLDDELRIRRRQSVKLRPPSRARRIIPLHRASSRGPCRSSSPGGRHRTAPGGGG